MNNEKPEAKTGHIGQLQIYSLLVDNRHINADSGLLYYLS